MTAPMGQSGQSAVPADPTSRPVRPDSIAIATELWLVVIVGQLIAFIAQYPTFSGEARKRVASMDNDLPHDQAQLLSSSGVLIASFVISAIFLCVVSALLVWLTRIGYTWARFLLSAVGLYVLLNMVMNLFHPVSPTWSTIPLVISGVAGLGASVLLMRRDSDSFCRAMAVYRRLAKQRPAYGVPPTYPTSYPYGVGPHPGYPPTGQQPTYGHETRRDDNPDERGSSGQS